MTWGLFFDIDGTLVSFKDHQIPQSTVDALAKAKENGHHIYIATGRPLQIITNLQAIAPLIDGYITTNGAFCFVGKEEVRCTPMLQADVEMLAEDAWKCDYPCIIAGERDFAVLNNHAVVDEVFCQELGVRNIDFSIDATKVIEEQRILQISPFFPEAHEKDILPRLQHCTSGRWHPAFTDVTSVEADKGLGLEEMARFLGLPLEATMAFGDGGNDLPILRKAGIGVAMGNAMDDVKAGADYVTASVDDAGIAQALKHFRVI